MDSVPAAMWTMQNKLHNLMFIISFVLTIALAKDRTEIVVSMLNILTNVNQSTPMKQTYLLQIPLSPCTRTIATGNRLK